MEEQFIKQFIQDFNPYHSDKFMTYEDGLLLITALKYYKLTQDPFYSSFVEDYLNLFIDEDGVIKSYKVKDFNIDNILAGNAIFEMHEMNHNIKLLKAIELLEFQLDHHPRTASRSFWHKLRYPYQVWLDGLYMGQIFRVRYALYSKHYEILDDVIHQFRNVRIHLWDDSRKAYVHAYDESRKMQWADSITGQSPNLWSRSAGWLAMAMVDIVELLQNDHPQITNELSGLFRELVEGIMTHQDKDSHMWFQVIDRPDIEGNYLETSGSAMLAYSMLKAFRLKMVPSSTFEEGKKIVEGIEKKYLHEHDGRFYLGGTCSVAGLDSEKRDGSIRYYLSEKIAENEVKGVAPYFLAKYEIELSKQQVSQ